MAKHQENEEVKAICIQILQFLRGAPKPVELKDVADATQLHSNSERYLLKKAMSFLVHAERVHVTRPKRNGCNFYTYRPTQVVGFCSIPWTAEGMSRLGQELS